MARSRNIKPGACKNEALAELGPMTQFLFVMLPCFADRDGRMEDRPKRIKAEIFPYYDADVDAMLQDLEDSPERFISRYEIDGKRYLQITNFNEHQTPHHKESESIIPPCVKHDSSMTQHQAKHDNLEREAIGISNKESVSRNQESGISMATSIAKLSFGHWWNLVPRKVAKGAAEKAYIQAVKRLECREDNPHHFLRERIEAYAKTPQAQGEYCPHPATWLNQERYDDDPATWQRGSPRSNTDPRGNLALRDKLLAEMESQ